MLTRVLNASRTAYSRGRHRLSTRTTRRPNLSATDAALLAKVKRDGVAVLEGFASREKCRALRRQVDQVFAQASDRLWHSDDGADVRAYAAETRSEAIAEHHADPRLLALAEAHLGLEQVCFFTLANRVRPTRDNRGSGQGWHRDSASELQFKTLLYLEDVTLENGPFEYLPGSHTVRSMVRGILGAGLDHGQHRLSDAELERLSRTLGTKPRAFAAKAGTLILAETSGVHRGMPIHSGERYVLTNYFMTPAQVESCWRHDKFTKYFVGYKPRASTR